jgi:hypothetical protein
VYELIHGNIKHTDELNENTKTRVLPFVLNIHNRVGRAANKLRKVFLRPAFFLTGVFYRQSEAMKIKFIFIMLTQNRKILFRKNRHFLHVPQSMIKPNVLDILHGVL